MIINHIPLHGFKMLRVVFGFVAVNPVQQEQLNPPTVLVQVEFDPQTSSSDKHSSTSVKKITFIKYMFMYILHAHIYMIRCVNFHP